MTEISSKRCSLWKLFQRSLVLDWPNLLLVELCAEGLRLLPLLNLIVKRFFRYGDMTDMDLRPFLFGHATIYAGNWASEVSSDFIRLVPWPLYSLVLNHGFRYSDADENTNLLKWNIRYVKVTKVFPALPILWLFSAGEHLTRDCPDRIDVDRCIHSILPSWCHLDVNHSWGLFGTISFDGVKCEIFSIPRSFNLSARSSLMSVSELPSSKIAKVSIEISPSGLLILTGTTWK